MIIKSLLLDNVGLYSQRTEFSLAPQKTSNNNRPIILIGGRNGAGKTTFLDAVRLALYGKRALGLAVSQKEYHQYLLNKTNQNHRTRASSIELKFIYTEGSVPAEYTVCRSWMIGSNGQLTENLELQKNGLTVTSVPKQEWENFLLELIPIGVSQLFFFDGEKIQEIAEDNNSSLSDAIKNLLGIDLIEKLRLDLHSYLNRNKSDSIDETNLNSLEQKVRQLKSEEEHAKNAYVQLKFEHQSLLQGIERDRLRFVSEGGAIALQYDQLKAKLSQTNKEINECKQELVNLANGLLPFLFAPKLISRFKNQLEESSADQSINKQLIEQTLLTFQQSPLKKNELWNDSHWANLNDFLADHFNYKTEVNIHKAFSELSEPQQALIKLMSLDLELRQKVKLLYERFSQLNQDKEATEFSISRAENAEDSNSNLDGLLLKERKLGEIEQLLNFKDEESRKVSQLVLSAERNLKAARDEVTEFELKNHKNALAAKGIKALLEFETALLNQKIDQVRKNFVEIFNTLLRKQNFIADLKIDLKTFNTSLIKVDGHSIEKSALSAGEKQIYAIAMLWALAKTSGRHLPMIIDTPLGRLDREHRDNLMKFYFPQVSHQVIILSTDTEIDDLYVNQLDEFISGSYLLEYNHELNSSQALPGYFTDLKRSTTEKRIALQQA